MFLPHLHSLSLLQGSMTGPPPDDPGHSAPVEREAVQDCRGVCFTTSFPHRGNTVEFSFPANVERLCHMAILQKPPKFCVMTGSNTEIPDPVELYSCLLKLEKKNTQPTHLLG